MTRTSSANFNSNKGQDSLSNALALSLTSSYPLELGNQLEPDFVAHVFEGELLTPFNHPLIAATSIQDDLRAASFQLHLLSPRTRVLVLCITAVSALISFHPAALGSGPRPTSFSDLSFFAVDAEVPVARERGIVLPSGSSGSKQPLPPVEAVGGGIYVACPRIGAIMAGNYYPGPSGSGALGRVSRLFNNHSLSGSPDLCVAQMAEALISTECRMPMLITRHDQLLLTGTNTPTLDALLALLTAAEEPGLYVLWPALQPYIFHVVCLARQLYESLNGDLARLKPLSEPAVINFLSALTTLHSILSTLLDRIAASITAAALANPLTPPPARGDPATVDSMARACALGIVVGFASLALPFHRELELAVRLPIEPRARERMRVFGAQARGFVGDAVREIARVFRWMPGVQFPPTSYRALCALVEAALAMDGDVQDVAAIATQLKLMAYSLDIYADPEVVSVLGRAEAYVATRSNNEIGENPQKQGFVDSLDSFMSLADPFDSVGLEDFFPPEEYTWLGMLGDGTGE
ncbi:hypothetical protein C8R46DRAFT_1026004 [Mycena filopes]|nr:hypothetical protein C8R46DRAFT_1026004 [Mycena filopes]